MVQAMAAGDYIRFLKSARMLQAEQAMLDIQSSSFPNYDKNAQRDVMRDLKRASVSHLFKPVKDFAEVAANFAKRLSNG